VYTWALKALPGQKMTYFKCDNKDPRRTQEDHASLHSAMKASDEGLVFLAQRRILRGPHSGWLYYEATRITPRIAKKLGVWPSDIRVVSYVPLRSSGRLEAMLDK
jgi:hypothetical protein